MLTTVAVALILTLPAEPPVKLKPPVVSFRGPAKDGTLILEFSNPNPQPLPYVGYTPDSFEGGLKKGTIAPMYRIEVLRCKKWGPHPTGWCGTGLGDASVAGKAKATFAVGLPGGDWEKFRVGVTWFKTPDRKESAVAWGDALSKDDVALEKP